MENSGAETPAARTEAANLTRMKSSAMGRIPHFSPARLLFWPMEWTNSMRAGAVRAEIRRKNIFGERARKIERRAAVGIFQPGNY
jgi:hypothetical protein